ncbi:MAG: amidohydrolase family protein [Gammaproteobacteria bacterium]
MSQSTPPPRGLHNPPPDPNPRVPKAALPDCGWDCHIHLFGPAREWPFTATSPYVSDDALPEDYLRMQRVLGLKRAVIVSAGGYGADYRHLKSVLERFGEYFRGIVLARDDFRADEMTLLHQLGVRGVRMFAGPPGHEWSHLPTINPNVASLVHEAGWHVQYQSLERGYLVNVADQLLAFPNPVVLDHFGAFDPGLGIDQPAFTTILRMLETGRVWLKMSGPMRCADGDFPYSAMLPFARSLVRHAPERLLWGSDWPHVQMNGRSMPNDGDLVDLLAEWVPDEATRFRILSHNPLALYA